MLHSAIGTPRGGAEEFAIDDAGVWYYRGSPIRREPLVRLLAGMLRRDATGHFLHTPEQRLRVRVADAPFLVVDFEQEGARLLFVTNLGARYPLDRQHPLEVRVVAERGTRLYQQIDNGLSARVERAVYYRLAELAVMHPAGSRYGVMSCGEFFPLE